MNQSEKCHRIQGCKRLYIDAFRAFKPLLEVEGNTFILTHYHADHWAGLPRGKSYIGPCKIHCTPVTGNLLREIHKLDNAFIVEHAYGSTWNDCDGNNITFYDANHCPGAAIVFVATREGQKHLHTGDMRYHDEKFRSYPLLSEAIQNRELDILYLDTTYAKPKHCFAPQDEAIEMIASQVGELLNSNQDIVSEKKQSFFQPKTKAKVKEIASSDVAQAPVRTLVLLSCYSIGKEKVLWNSALQSKQLVFVNKTKHRMLQCIKAHQDVEASSGIIDRCTLDPKKSDIHVITMGTAGSLHPFFQPNFEECALYAHRLNKGYNKVVAFLPTGWANSSKYNRENGVAKKIVDLKEIVKKGKVNGNNHMMDVEVRCVAYSEHSSYNELRACVEYTRPKQIIPTVFSGEKDYAAIEKRFQDLVDSQRAKQAFISKISGIGVKRKAAAIMKKQKISRPQYSTKAVSKVQMPQIMPYKKGRSNLQNKEDKVPHQKLNAPTMSAAKVHEESLVEKCGMSKQNVRQKTIADDAKVAMMVSMGFNPSRSSESLIAKSNNLEEAIEWLLSR
uniref:UBA domain-containing protein n=1 Tax=Chaetoceros debilis TaxID=122233 RepID=A0A7S3V473_9STRA